MSQERLYDLTSNLQAEVSGSPGGTALSGTTASNGSSVDTQGLSGPVHGVFLAGAATGTPTSFSVACKLQESDDGSTGWADIANQRTGTLDAAGEVAVVQGHHTKRYVRTVATPAFTGGTSPTLPYASAVCGAKERV